MQIQNFKIQNNKIRNSLLVILGIYILLSIPFKDGRSTYAYNELGRDLEVVKTLDNGQLIKLGPVSSLGNYHFGPAYYYLVYPFAKLLNFSLFSLAIASGFFMLLTIAGIFYLTRDWFKNDEVALLAAFLAAFSTLTFQLTKYGSNPNFIPFFVIVFFFSLKFLIENPKSVWITLVVAFSFAILTQLHAVPLLVLPFVLLETVVFTDLKSAPWYNYLVFLGVTLLIYAPYLLYEFPNHFSNTLALFDSPGSAPLTFFSYLGHIVQFWGFITNPIISTHSFFNALDLGGPVFSVLVAAIVIGGVALYIYSKGKKSVPSKLTIESLNPNVKKLLLMWIATSTVLFLLPLGTANNYHYYYFFILYPVLFILFALAIFELKNRGHKYLFWYFIASFLILEFVQMGIYIKVVLGIKI